MELTEEDEDDEKICDPSRYSLTTTTTTTTTTRKTNNTSLPIALNRAFTMTPTPSSEPILSSHNVAISEDVCSSFKTRR